MTKKIGDKKLGGIKQANLAQGVQGADSVNGAESVAGIKNVAPTSGVGSVKGAGAVGSGKRRATHTMTIEEREQILQAISDEASKMFSNSRVSERKKQVITKAVQMAVDSGLIEKPAGEEKK